jgi:hypothetical protein
MTDDGATKATIDAVRLCLGLAPLYAADPRKPSIILPRQFGTVGTPKWALTRQWDLERFEAGSMVHRGNATRPRVRRERSTDAAASKAGAK